MAKRNRKAYDMPEELTARIDEICEELKIPQGHLMALLALEGLEKFENGEINLDEYLELHLNSLKYRWRLNLASRLAKYRNDEDE